MEAIDYFKNYVAKATPILDSFFQNKTKEAAKISPIIVKMMKVYRQFMGGKNVRGSLTKLGYECFGGKNEKAILKASLMVEITHSFILIHDDVMDKDPLRRGRPTIHVQYEKSAQRQKQKRNHYGLCMAINLGDAGYALAHLLLAGADFEDEIKVKVLKRFNQQVLTTTFGQALDVTYEITKNLTEEKVLQVHHCKTANYTITGPLQYGALFAGASEKEIKKIEKYGLPVGIAFQLRDDELGLYADEDKIGKPVGSDVKQNKNTILKIKALEWATLQERKFLKYAYGNQNLTKKEVKKVREITTQTGAFAYSQKMARDLVEKGKKFVSQVSSNPKLQEMLGKMADFMIEREK